MHGSVKSRLQTYPPLFTCVTVILQILNPVNAVDTVSRAVWDWKGKGKTGLEIPVQN